MSQLPPLNSLRCFLYVGKNLSFKKASEELFVSQAAVSQQIKSIESFLGKKLFIRMNREIKLTKDGKMLLTYVEKGFECFNLGIEALEDDPNPNCLTISVLPSFASRWLVPRLRKFLDNNPDLTVRLEPSLEQADFKNSDVDLGIRFGKGLYAGLKSIFLMGDLMFPACHPSLLKNNELHIDQLREIPLFEDDIITTWKQFFNEHGLRGPDFKSAIHVPDSNMLVEAVLSCQGIAMLRHSLVYELIKKKQIVRPFPVIYKSEFSYFLVAPENHFCRAKVIKFVDWLQHELKYLKESAAKLLNENPPDSES